MHIYTIGIKVIKKNNSGTPPNINIFPMFFYEVPDLTHYSSTRTLTEIGLSVSDIAIKSSTIIRTL